MPSAKSEGDGIKRQLICLPTGTGKTIVFAMLIGERDERSLIIVNRDILVSQTLDKVRMMNPDADIGVVKAEQNELDNKITVASIDTLKNDKRLSQLGTDYGLVITDEAHHSIAPSYQKVYDYLGIGNNGKLHVGMTATPNRTDGKGLVTSYDEVVYEKGLIEMIAHGHLCDLRSEIIQIYDPENKELADILKKSNKLTSKVLTKILALPDVAGHIVREWKRLAGDRQTVAFCAKVEHAYQMAELFRQHGVASEAVTDKTRNEQREQILSDYASGTIQVVTNFNVLTEGFDSPQTSCILVARPTDSDLVYAQMVGRGTRIAPGKEDCLILDIAAISEERNLLQFADLVGRDIGNKSVSETVVEDVKARNAYADELGLASDFTINKTRKGDPFAASRFAWVESKGEYKIYTGYKLGKAYLKKADKLDHYLIVLEDEQLRPEPLPLDWAMTLVESYVNKFDPSNFARRNSGWRKQRATGNQRNLITKSGHKAKEDMTRGEASDIIEKITWNWKPKQKEKSKK